jgi:hypothetical protein
MIEVPGLVVQVGGIAKPDHLVARLLREVSRQQLELAGEVLVYEKNAHA